MKLKALFAAVALMLAGGSAWARSPNESVHVLQKRDYSVKNKLEVNLFGGPSVGDVFTQQIGTGLALAYHFDEAFALELSWMSCKLPFADGTEAVKGEGFDGDNFRWGMSYTDAYDEVKNDAQLSPSNADLAMITNYVGMNVQFSPLYGKWTIFDWGLGHADFYLTAGGGVAGTEFRNSRKLWQDTGTYFVGNFGLGFRVYLARWFALRVEVRDYAFAARVQENVSAAGGTPDVSTKIRNTLFVTLGLSFLFLGEEPVQIWSPY
jgi:outer membrane beta-barrel protein